MFNSGGCGYTYQDQGLQVRIVRQQLDLLKGYGLVEFNRGRFRAGYGCIYAHLSPEW